jgi:5'-nucleotidase
MLLPPATAIDKRVFVNRTVNMDRIEYVGFDMDYTLAVYTTEYELLAYGLCLKKLVESKGYPKELIGSLSYDSSFPIRGLFLGTYFVCLAL